MLSDYLRGATLRQEQANIGSILIVWPFGSYMVRTRRSFIQTTVIAGVVSVAGCSGDSEEDSVTIDSERTTVDAGGDSVIWTWTGWLDADGYSEAVPVRVDIRLFDESGEEIETVSKVIHVDYIGANSKHEVSYTATADVINRIYDYEVTLTVVQD